MLNPPCNDNIRGLSKVMAESEMLKRLSDCGRYFDLMPVDAIRLEGKERPRDIRFAFTFQVHEGIAILEMFLAAMYR